MSQMLRLVEEMHVRLNEISASEQTLLRTLRDAIGFGPPDANDIRTARVGRGTVLGGDALEALLDRIRPSQAPT